jgi:glucose/arabinose dehydrogenase
MSTTTRLLTTAACVLALTGCAAGGSEDTATTTAPPAATPTAAPTTPEATAPTPTGVPAEALLPDAAWAPVTGPREESEGITDWRLPASCAVGSASTAVAMRTVTVGDGAEEAQVGAQQVVVFPDADAAVAEADRLTAVLAGCTSPDGTTTYVTEPLAVGAQGVGLATDYYGTSAEGAVDDGAMGSYLALTRRGAALTLVALEGGESTVGASRETVTAHAQAAWELLCPYDADGC